MKIKIFAGMAVLALLFGLVLAGCQTLGIGTPSNHVDTATSEAIYQDAVELVASKARGERGDVVVFSVKDLMAELANKYSGLTLSSTSGNGITFEYQGNSYFMRVDYAGSAIARANVGKVYSVKQVIEE